MDSDIEHLTLFYRFASAVGLGLLVGLQREYASSHDASERRELFAGTRTYALLAALGCTTAYVGALSGSAVPFAVMLFVVGAMITTSYHFSAREGRFGLTSEVAAFITMLAGALCFWGKVEFAAALAVATTVLLALKLQTVSLVSRVTAEDVRATLTFAVLTLVVLPVLPRHGWGPPPFDVLVPYKAWLMVVFISGISFLGYVLIKVVGTRRGVGLTGLLGGLASSTAVTLSFAARSRGADALARPLALAILLAWTVMFVRVLAEVAALNRALLGVVWLPLTAAAAISVVYCAWLHYAERRATGDADTEFKNPFELAPALKFGGLYMLILLGANAARLEFGDAGLYVSALVSGLADVDAITLSMAELSRTADGPALPVAARAIVLAAASNTLVKGAIVLGTGTPALRRVILPGLVLTLATAIGVVFLL
ncbi:MAG: MgtC/SapB family protein [Gammaproteobacteria bacterium]